MKFFKSFNAALNVHGPKRFQFSILGAFLLRIVHLVFIVALLTQNGMLSILKHIGFFEATLLVIGVLGLALIITGEKVMEILSLIDLFRKYRKFVGEWPVLTQVEFGLQLHTLILPELGRRASSLHATYGNVNSTKDDWDVAKRRFRAEGLDVVTDEMLPVPLRLTGEFDTSYKSYLRYAPKVA